MINQLYASLSFKPSKTNPWDGVDSTRDEIEIIMGFDFPDTFYAIKSKEKNVYMYDVRMIDNMQANGLACFSNVEKGKKYLKELSDKNRTTENMPEFTVVSILFTIARQIVKARMERETGSSRPNCLLILDNLDKPEVHWLA